MAKSDTLDPETKARIAAHLRRKMKELGLSKRGLAKQIGIDPPSLVKILNATRNVGTAVLVKIHRNLHIDLNQLVDVDPSREFFHASDQDSEGPPLSPSRISPSAQPGRSGGYGAVRHPNLNARSAMVHEEQAPYGGKARKARP